MTRPLRTCALVALLLVGAVGVPGAFTDSGAAATSGTVEIDRAISDDGEGVTLSFTVDATSNGSISVPDSPASGDDDVTFSFDGWEDTTTGESGSSSSWTVVAGHTYRITYQAGVMNGANGGSDGSVDTTVSISGDASRSSEQLSVSIDYLYPDVGYIGEQTGEVTFEGGSTATGTVSISVPNDGSGALKLTDVQYQNVPSGIQVSTNDLPKTVDGRRTGSLSLDVTVQDSVDAGSYSFDVTLVDNLDSTSDPTVPVTVDVRKPPAVGVETIDVGDVLVGTQKTKTFTINEVNGYQGISGVDATVAGNPQFGTMSFSGLSYVSTQPGGSDEAEVTVSVSEEAGQHAQLEWTVELTPEDSNGVSDTTTIQARVIYPGYFGSVTMDDSTIVFDQPRSSTSTFTKRVEVEVDNDGDRPLDITGAQARSGDTRVDADVVERPDAIEGQSSGTVVVELEATSSAPEFSDEVTVTMQSADAGSTSVTAGYEVEHEIGLDVERTTLDYGELDVTKSATRSTDIAETLGYKDVTGLEIEKTSGPDRWLTVVERPSGTLSAGESAPFVVETRFTSDATLYKEYTWTFRVSADNAPTRNITVTARAKPFTVETIREPLTEHESADDWRGTVAGSMVDSIDALTQKLKRNESISRSDLPSVVAAARTANLFVESASSAEAEIEAGDHRNATDDIVRAAAAYNLMEVYVPRIDDPTAARHARQSKSAAGDKLQSLIEEQTRYFESRLSSSDVTAIERAAIHRDLAQIAELRGDAETARTHRQQATTAFDTYLSLVEAGSENRVEATTQYESLEDSTFTTVVGYSLMLNPADWDRFSTTRDRVLSKYDTSAEKFAAAGAVEKAEETRERRAAAASAFRTARYSLFVASGIYLVGFAAFLRYLALGIYAYIRDAREAVTGDFLL